MDLQGDYRFATPREAVWAALMDPAALRVAIPGCESLSESGPDAYDIIVKVGLGGLHLRLDGHVAMANAEPPDRYTLSGAGSSRGGGVRGDARIELTVDGEETLLTYVGDVHARGAVARVGSRLMRSTAQLMIKRFFGALDELLIERTRNGG